MSKLHPINHDLPGILWCGPAALSACCGVATSQVHAVIKSLHGNPSKPVKGVSNGTLAKAAAHFGFKLVSIWEMWDTGAGAKRKQPTLARFTQDFRRLLTDFPVIVNVTGHYVVVQGRTFVDNQVKTPVALKKAPHRRCRVKRAWQVVKIGDAQPVPELPKRDAVRLPYNSPKMEARRLARQHGIQLDPHHSGVDGENWVYPPPGLESEEKDFYYGDHVAYDWKETLEKVKRYVSDLSKSPVEQPVRTVLTPRAI